MNKNALHQCHLWNTHKTFQLDMHKQNGNINEYKHQEQKSIVA